MPLEAWHRNKAHHNLETNNYLRNAPNQYLDWEATTLFYVAVHLIEGYLARRNIHPESHIERKRYINQYLQTIRTDYLILSSTSRKARYKRDIQAQDRDKAWEKLSAIRTFFETQGLEI